MNGPDLNAIGKAGVDRRNEGRDYSCVKSCEIKSVVLLMNWRYREVAETELVEVVISQAVLRADE